MNELNDYDESFNINEECKNYEHYEHCYSDERSNNKHEEVQTQKTSNATNGSDEKLPSPHAPKNTFDNDDRKKQDNFFNQHETEDEFNRNDYHDFVNDYFQNSLTEPSSIWKHLLSILPSIKMRCVIAAFLLMMIVSVTASQFFLSTFNGNIWHACSY